MCLLVWIGVPEMAESQGTSIDALLVCIRFHGSAQVGNTGGIIASIIRKSGISVTLGEHVHTF